MELFLFRHAQPLWIDNGLCIDNPPLTELGRRQAKLLGKRLARERMITFTFLRCCEPDKPPNRF